MTELKNYLKEARQEFCKEVNKYNVSDDLQLRTACDSFLIAFDQATEKAINYTHCCESDSELFICPNGCGQNGDLGSCYSCVGK